MLSHKQMMEDSAAFFNKEVDKVINNITTAKTNKQRIKYFKQMMALKCRALEIRMIDDSQNF
jgi:hypothetical protein